MKYKHYAPKAKVILVKGTAERYREFVNSKKAPGVGALCFDEDRHLLKVPSVPYGSGNDSAAQAISSKQSASLYRLMLSA